MVFSLSNIHFIIHYFINHHSLYYLPFITLLFNQVEISGRELEELLFTDKGFMFVNVDEDKTGVRVPEFLSKGKLFKIQYCVPNLSSANKSTYLICPAVGISLKSVHDHICLLVINTKA